MTPLSRPLQAIVLMVSAMAGFAAMGVTLRLLSETMHPAMIVFLRNATALILMISWAVWRSRGKKPDFATSRLNGHFWRATVGIASMEIWFYSLTILPLTLATALSFTTPIFSTIFAILFLGEKAGWRRWSAILLGFLGVLVILPPGSEAIDPRVVLVLLASSLTAVSGVMIKSLTRTETPETIVFYMALFMTPWSLLPALMHWQEITAYQWFMVFLIAVFSTGAHLMLAHAFRRADMVVLMPFDFTRLIFMAILAYVFLGETMDENTLMGALVIVGCTVYIAHREAKRNRGKAEIAQPNLP